MYRKSDIQIFTTLGAVANLTLIAAFVFLVVYHFFDGQLRYRNLGFALLVLSWLLKLQVMIQKVDVLEIRLWTVTESRTAANRLPIRLEQFFSLIYLIVFWVSIAGVVLGYIPAREWQFHF